MTSHPASLALLTGPAILLPLAAYALARPRVRGAHWYALLLLTIAFWSVAYAFELSLHDVGTKMLALRIKYLAVVLLPSGWTGFVLAFVGFPPSRVWRRVTPVALVSAAMLVLAWTDSSHGWFWGDLTLERIGGYEVLRGRGPFFWVNVFYTYCVLVAGAIVVVSHAVHSPYLYRKRAAILIAGAILPWAGNVAFVFNRQETIIDPTPFLFTCTAVIAALSVFRYEILEPVPTLREARIEAIGDGVVILDRRRRVADLNPVAASILGWTRAEAAGRVIDGLLVGWPAGSLPEGPLDVVVGTPPNARVYDVRASEVRSRAGEVTGTVVVLRDVTERRLAERALRESEQRYRAVIEQAFDGVWLADQAGVIVDANPGACAILGYARDELLGRRERDLMDPDEPTGWPASSADVAAGTDWRHPVVSKDGRRLLLAGRSRKLGADLVVSTFRDVTEEQAEAERRERLLQDARAANRLKDEFLATVSHELRTPLTAVLGWARMLVRKQVQPGRVAHALRVIERNAQAQARLVDDLLDLSRITGGRLRLTLAPTDVAAVVRDVVEAIGPSAGAKRLMLRMQLADLPPITVDQTRLQQVVWNLLTNAIKFTPPGGTVTVRSAAAPGGMELMVRDSGRGIAPEFLPFIFDPFRQGESGPTRSASGLGLGLAIVRHLVEAHGGYVEAASEGVGRGAAFRVYLPALPAGTVQQPSAADEFSA